MSFFYDAFYNNIKSAFRVAVFSNDKITQKKKEQERKERGTIEHFIFVNLYKAMKLCIELKVFPFGFVSLECDVDICSLFGAIS